MPPDTTPLPPAQLLSPPRPRAYGAVNWLGLYTLASRETRRFFKVYSQTIIAPVVTTLLLLAVFALALGGAMREVGGVPFSEFLVPGLIMMAMTQNAFANTSSSLTISKMQGSIVDTLLPPLSATELTLGYALGGVLRGIAVGATVAICLVPFSTIHMAHPFYVVFHGLAASLMLSLLGLAGGIWAEKIDHVAAVTNFVVAPAAFLSGTFYTIDRLPPPWHEIALWNPFFYMIDGFRYGFIGHADGNLGLGIVLMTVTNLALFVLCHWMFRTGYKLRA